MARTLPRKNFAATVLALSTVALATTLIATPSFGDCSLTSTGLVPLTDLGTGLYLGQYQGGLYPDGASIRPKALRKASTKRRKQVEPLDVNGNPDPDDGAILFLSIGISNTKLEFDNFQVRAEADPAVNPQVVMFNAAQGGTPANEWVDPNGEPWTKILRVLNREGFTPEQVQVIWLKHAHSRAAENGPFPTHAQLLQQDLEAVARGIKHNYPNIKLVFVSSRTRAYTDDPSKQSPEPYAYENGFAVKWMIEKQINGDPDLSHEDDEAVAPLLLWGPYIWADGTSGRSDGFVWSCNDTRTNEFIHPSDDGMRKIGSQLLAFFKTHPTSRKWFLRTGTGNKPKLTLSFSDKKGPAPHRVEFNADASVVGNAKDIHDYSWTFDDGTFSRAKSPSKVFLTPGKYKIWVTVTDDQGNFRSKKKKIVVQ